MVSDRYRLAPKIRMRVKETAVETHAIPLADLYAPSASFNIKFLIALNLPGFK